MKIYRVAMGLSQEALADKLKVHRRTIIRCENGKGTQTRLSIEQFQRFCRLIYEELGLGGLLHFISAQSSNYEAGQDIEQILAQEKSRRIP